MTAERPGDLFALVVDSDDNRPAWLPSRADRERMRQRDAERLEPVVVQIAQRVGAEGFTADDVRDVAIASGVLTGDEAANGKQRALSWLGPFLSALAKRGLIVALTYPDGAKVRRASARPASNGNLQVVYVLPQHATRRSA